MVIDTKDHGELIKSTVMAFILICRQMKNTREIGLMVKKAVMVLISMQS